MLKFFSSTKFVRQSWIRNVTETILQQNVVNSDIFLMATPEQWGSICGFFLFLPRTRAEIV